MGSWCLHWIMGRANICKHLKYIYIIYIYIQFWAWVFNSFCKVLVDFVDSTGLINFLGWFGVIQTYFCVFQNLNVTIPSVYNILSLWHFHLCHENYAVLFFSEFSVRGILCLIETSQLVLACEFAFALPDFWLAEFSDHNKNDLFAIFQSKLIKKQIFLN